MNDNVNDSENIAQLEKNKILLNLPSNVLKEAVSEFSKDKKCKLFHFVKYEI